MSLQNGTETEQAAAPTSAAPKLGLALLVIATAQLMLVLDDTIVNVALPSMQRPLHLPTAHLNWVISFYVLTFGGLMLAGGRAGDLFGRLRVFRLGIVVFILASLAGGFSPNGTALIIARSVQGCGAAIAAPGALSLLTTTFPAGSARTKALGVYGAMGGLGSVVGLLLGGALTEYLSWRWVLFVNVPIAIAVLAGTSTLVPGDSERGRLDVPGAVTATLAIGSLVYALTRADTNGWTDAGTLITFAVAVALLVAFGLIARSSPAPMVLPGLVRDRNRAGANTVMLLLGCGMLAMFYLLVPAMLIGGVGTGLTFVGCTAVAMLGVSPRDAGVAAGLLNTSTQTGNALGVAALAAIATIVTRNHLASHPVPVALTDGYVAGLLAGAIIYAVAALVALFVINARVSDAH
jgi:MFS family permease